ncbi:MAG: septum formation protein Maf [Phycisphaerales bacterium]|jgi:septum formation protein|nr:septum formation protein Maf [Phycisphaerales bacterium]MBT7171779.1 septum formation protein Maf [Phycisphaerales bacterium]
MTNEPLILASASPRRRELLAEILGEGHFDVIPSTLDEPRCFGDLSPAFEAQSLALFKAADIAAQHPGRWVLGADTLVACRFPRHAVLGKPRDEAHAREMLHNLSRAPHEVITAMALIDPEGQSTVVADTTLVYMRAMSEADIDAYIATGEWQGKAGAYGIQGKADRYVERIEGSFSNVVGLCVKRTKLLMNKFGIISAKQEK